MFSAGRTAGDEADRADDERDAEPAGERELLMQPEFAEHGNDDVAEGGGGHHEGEVGPAERGGVAGEEADEQDNAGVDEGVEERLPEEAKVVHVYCADLGHAAGEEGVAYRCGEHDGDQDGVLGGLEDVFHFAGAGLGLLRIAAPPNRS